MPRHLFADRSRRARTTAQERATYLAAFERSDLSAAAFCRTHGLVPATFASWQRTARAARRGAPFARVVVAGASEVRVVLRGPHGEAELTGVDPATLVRVVRTWARVGRG